MKPAPARGVIGFRVAVEGDWQAAQRQVRAGRWHVAGDRVVYTSRSPELAILEARVHHAPGMGPYRMYCVTGPRASTRTLTHADLPDDWRAQPARTRALGHAWLRSRAHTVLRVPSAVCVWAYNLLLNPVLAYPPRWRLHDLGPFRFDRRLVLPPRKG